MKVAFPRRRMLGTALCVLFVHGAVAGCALDGDPAEDGAASPLVQSPSSVSEEPADDGFGSQFAVDVEAEDESLELVDTFEIDIADPGEGAQVAAVDNGGCSKAKNLLNSRVQACISRPHPNVVVADAYVSIVTPTPCGTCRSFRLFLWRDLPNAVDPVVKSALFPYRRGRISLGQVNVSAGRYYAEVWVLEGNANRGTVDSPRQIVH
ncbi:MAG TPA: hypothetical protein VK427_11130 [Kofleriaceae bacterium]|nr:hypothetical protein [Kofleriaceae bacterium]